jgi:hypothetical protein
MPKILTGVAWLFAIFIIFSPPAAAQSKPPVKSASAASPDTSRDLSGVWMLDRPRLIRVVERYWIYELNLEEPPMTAWGKAQYEAAKSSFGTHSFPLAETNDPIFHTCTPPGFPRIFLHPYPMQVVQVPGEVIMLFEWDSMRHPIFTDGRPHDTTLGPLWMGDSIGHWEGDTLVADTVNFNTRTWLDRVGHPHSDALHVMERIRRINHDHLVDDITIDDPKAYTKPWTGHLDFLLRPQWTLAEQFCEDQGSFDEIEKKETAPAK